MNDKIILSLIIKGVPEYRNTKLYEYLHKDSQIHLRLSREAYDWMTSDIRPRECKYNWMKFTKNQRIDFHMKLIAEERGAYKYSFSVLDD